MKKRLLLVDDHSLLREGLAGIISAQPDLQVVGQAEDGLEALVMARSLRPDLILMDIHMPSCDGLEATRLIKAELPDTIIVILTVSENEDKLFEAIRCGAQGYLLKNISSAEMLTMIRGALRGDAAISPSMAGKMLAEFRRLSQVTPKYISGGPDDLTQREIQVLTLVAQGRSDKDISERLSISIYTVKSHLRNILAKLHVNNRRQAVREARRTGIV